MPETKAETKANDEADGGLIHFTHRLPGEPLPPSEEGEQAMLTEETYDGLMREVQEARHALSALVRETSVPNPDWDRVRAAREQVVGQAACVADATDRILWCGHVD